MNYPILYDANETDFDNNGIGVLSDCVKCLVTEVKNGEFELEMTYPVSGIHFSEIKSRSIIKAKPNQVAQPQLFRVYAQKKAMHKNVVIKAEHISYDLGGFPVVPFKAENAALAFSTLKPASVSEHPFSFWTDKGDVGDFELKSPASTRFAIGQLVETYGGELEFDNYWVKLYSRRGLDRGVTIRYGKNLTDLKQDENCSAVFTAVYPYWIDTKGENFVELPEKTVPCPGTYSFTRIKTVNMATYFSGKPTVDELRTATDEYIAENAVGVPAVSMTVSFAALEQSSEYAHLAILENVALCDTVGVEFPQMGVSASANAVKVVYNVLLDRVESVTLGSVKTNISDTITEQKKEIEKIPTSSQLQLAQELLTKALLGAEGGSVRFLDTNYDGVPDTLYIADNADPALAKKVWRFNYEGWGASKNGYAGPFIMGATFESGILAEFITAGTLYGMLVKAGYIESADGKIKIDLNNNAGSAVFNSGVSTNGLNVRLDEADVKSAFDVSFEQDEGESFKKIVAKLFSQVGYPFLKIIEKTPTNENINPGGYLAIDATGSTASIDVSENESKIYVGGQYGNAELSSGTFNNPKSYISVDTILPGSNANFEWVEIPSIGKTVLALKN